MASGGYRRKKTHKGRKAFSRSCRTSSRTRDLDQVQEDLRKGDALVHEYDEDLPGGGQFPCVPCAKHFQSPGDLAEHCRGKCHKKRVRLLREPAYTLAEAEAAGGLGTEAFYAMAK